MTLGTTETRPRETRLPRDAALPGLSLLHEPARLIETLSPLLADWGGREARILDVVADVRRYAPGRRCIVELKLHAGERREPRTLIAKMYPDDRGRQVHEITQMLWEDGFGNGRLRIPQPLAYSGFWQMSMVTRVEGQPLKNLLLADADVAQSMEAAAHWLHKLERCRVSNARVYSLDRHLHTLKAREQSLAQIDPGAMSAFRGVLSRVEQQCRAVSGARSLPTHRDFSPDHLLVDGDQLTVIDFDEFCQYDPLFDVAHFIAHVRYLALSNRGSLIHFDDLADRFHSVYAAGAADYSNERLRLNLAIAYLKLALIVALVTRPKDWQEFTNVLMREARRYV
jgi:phosphotransferase family enzyme